MYENVYVIVYVKIFDNYIFLYNNVYMDNI